MSNSSTTAEPVAANSDRRRFRKIESRLNDLERVKDRQQAASRRLDRIEKKLQRLEEREERHSQEPVGRCVYCWEGDLVQVGSAVDCTNCGYHFE